MPAGKWKHFVRSGATGCLVLLFCALAGGQQGADTRSQSDVETRIEGVIAGRDIDVMTVRALTGGETVVQLTRSTLILESDAEKTYDRDVLIRGLYVGVMVRKTPAGELVAEKVTFTRQDLKFARVVDAQVGSVRDRMAQIESLSQRLSGQLDELAAVSNTARGGSRAAQETADAAIAAVGAISGNLQRLGLVVREFPWPPPRASATTSIPRRFMLRPDFPITLSDASERLRTALDSAGYSEVSWYAVPGGFALATRIEQFKLDGRPASGQARWSVSDVPSLEGPRDYMRALFTANPGHYRVIVFIVSDRPLSQADARVSEVEAQAWLHRGVTALPGEIGAGAFSGAHNCTALIYQFKRALNQPPAYVDASPLPGRQHLQQSGVWRGLER